MGDNTLQREEQLKEASQYWKNEIDRITDPAILLGDFSNHGKVKSQEFTFRLKENIGQDLNKRSKGNQIVTLIFLLSGFDILLYQATQKQNIVVGTPVFQSSEFNEAVFFVENLNEGKSFKEHVTRVSEHVKKSYENQFMPIESVISQTKQAELESVLLKYMLQLDTIHDKQRAKQYVEEGKTELAFCLSPNEEWQGTVLYNSEKYMEETIESYVEVYQQILDHMLNHMEQCVGSVNQGDIWEPACEEYCEADAIPFFDSIREKDDNYVVLVDENRKLIQKELWEQSTILMDELQERHKNCAGTVAIMVSETADALIAMLGVLRAGMDFVVLSPDMDKEQRQTIIQDSRAVILIEEEKPGYKLTELNSKEPGGNHNCLCKIYNISQNGQPLGITVDKRYLEKEWDIFADLTETEERKRIAIPVSLLAKAPLYLVQLIRNHNFTIYTMPEQVLYSKEAMDEFVCEKEINLLVIPAFSARYTTGMSADSLEKIVVLGLVDEYRIYKESKSLTKYRFLFDTFSVIPYVSAYDISDCDEEITWIPLTEMADGISVEITDGGGHLQISNLAGKLSIAGDGYIKGEGSGEENQFYGKRTKDGRVWIYHEATTQEDAVAYDWERDDSNNEIKDTLFQIWRSILGNREFGENDRFLENGGNSALLLRMVALIERKYPGIVKVADAFTYSTIKEMTQFIKNRQGMEEKEKEISYQDIEKYTNQLPMQYFMPDTQGDKKYTTLVKELEEDLCDRIIAYCQKENILVEGLVLAAYLLGLKEVVQGEEVHLHYILNAQERVSDITVSKQQSDSDLLDFIRKKLESEEVLFHINELKWADVKKKDQKAMMLLYDMDSYHFNPDILVLYDFVLGISISDDDEITMIYRFNSQYLNSKETKGLIQGILQQISILACLER